jgi:4-carboxymuconolactone decarboxylase
MAADEEVAYDFCTELRQNQSVTDATYGRAISAFGEQGVVDMSVLVGYYTTLAMIMNVARTPMHEGEKPPLSPFPH